VKCLITVETGPGKEVLLQYAFEQNQEDAERYPSDAGYLPQRSNYFAGYDEIGHGAMFALRSFARLIFPRRSTSAEEYTP
jgi:hypothetical protein